MQAVVAAATAKATAEAGRGCSGGHRRAGQRARPPPAIAAAKVPAMLLVERYATAEMRPWVVASEVVVFGGSGNNVAALRLRHEQPRLSGTGQQQRDRLGRASALLLRDDHPTISRVWRTMFPWGSEPNTTRRYRVAGRRHADGSAATQCFAAGSSALSRAIPSSPGGRCTAVGTGGRQQLRAAAPRPLLSPSPVAAAAHPPAAVASSPTHVPPPKVSYVLPPATSLRLP